MAELNYKIRQLDEEWEIFNECVTKMNVYYEIEIHVPIWLDLDALSYLNESFENLEPRDIVVSDDSLETVYIYGICISSMAKCDLSKDEFSEVTGVYICETRAEIKVLEKVKRVITNIYKTIGLNDNRENLNNLINERLEKNNLNLERLKGNN